jgi:hypothetical protein
MAADEASYVGRPKLLVDAVAAVAATASGRVALAVRTTLADHAGGNADRDQTVRVRTAAVAAISAVSVGVVVTPRESATRESQRPESYRADCDGGTLPKLAHLRSPF